MVVVGRSMSVGDHSYIRFLIPQGTLPWQPVLSVLSTELHSADLLDTGGWWHSRA